MGAAAVAAIAVAVAVSFKRHGTRSRAPGFADIVGESLLPEPRVSRLQLHSMEPQDFHDLCAAYYQSRQFHLRERHVRTDTRDASLFFGTLPYPVAMVRVIGRGRIVDIDAIHDLPDAMQRREVARGIVHAPGRYTEDAMNYARMHRIRLVSGEDLVRNIAGMPHDARVAMCRALAVETGETTPHSDLAVH
ncbi:MAG: restriction endonuclease [Rhodospirillaceae bacterium]